MNDTLLTIEQNEKQFSIFSNTISTIISINHTKITTINKALKKDSAITLQNYESQQTLLIMK
jgi:hypothetical protein